MRSIGRSVLLGALALVCGVTGAAAQFADRATPDGTFYSSPVLNGAAVDWCANFAQGCGQQGADQFCRSQGYTGASRWDRFMTDRTYVLGSRTYCDNRGGCGALRDIVCVGGNSFGSQASQNTGVSGCGWIDGYDRNVPGDSGRGVRNARAHYDYAARTRGAVAQAVAARLEALRGCASAEAFARFYGDASVMIARIGIEKAGWRDMQDPNAPSGDTGRGNLNAQGHYRYAIGGGAPSVPRTIGDRMRILNGSLSQAEYAQLYADLSILIATYAQSGR